MTALKKGVLDSLKEFVSLDERSDLMTLNEVREEKKELEKYISELIDKFEEKHRVMVTCINLEKIDLSNKTDGKVFANKIVLNTQL